MWGIENKKPKIVLLENVKHLVHHDNGNTLKVIIKSLESLNYFVSWKILNAKDFGLAQNRERIIIVASKDGAFDFSKIETTPSKTIRDILDNHTFSNEKMIDGYTLLDESLWKKQKSGMIFCGYLNKNMRQKGVLPNTEHLSRVHKQPNRIYHIDGTHPTLSSQETTGRYFISDGKQVRKLTIDECYRLQGFNKDFKRNASLSASYSQIGNSVAVPMIEAVYKQIVSQFFK